jgi:hypothetical protein
MIFASKQRAIEVARDFQLPGYPQGYACRIAEGWTVIASWRPLFVGQFGILELA